MATLTATEQNRLGLVRPELMQYLLALMDAAAGIGLKLAVWPEGGTRSSDKQAALYADALKQGGGSDTAYAVAKPGTSRHEFGAAFDVHIVAGGETDANYRRLADIGQNLGLVAGYYFDHRGVGKHDPYHFQLNETLEQSRARWEAMQAAGITSAREVLLRRSQSLPSSSPSSSQSSR